MKNKTKLEHKFTLIVGSRWTGFNVTRKEAYHAVLSCFAKRDPDDCSFHLLVKKPKDLRLERKFKAAKEFCRKNGFIFRILTERDIF